MLGLKAEINELHQNEIVLKQDIKELQNMLKVDAAYQAREGQS